MCFEMKFLPLQSSVLAKGFYLDPLIKGVAGW
jgi:hypothetical protein